MHVLGMYVVNYFYRIFYGSSSYIILYLKFIECSELCRRVCIKSCYKLFCPLFSSANRKLASNSEWRGTHETERPQKSMAVQILIITTYDM